MNTKTILTAGDGLEIEVRPGTIEDVPLLISLIKELAEFEKLKAQATPNGLLNSLFGEHPAAYSLLAFLDGNPVGYMVYYFTFSTMVGKRSLWLEDLYLKPKYRGKGIGKALIAYIVEIAVQNDCGRIEWIVLDWNEKAIGFYKGMGATLLDEWRICRIDTSGLVTKDNRKI